MKHRVATYSTSYSRASMDHTAGGHVSPDAVAIDGGLGF